MVAHYNLSGAIPEGNSSYVKRKADDELYKELKAGEFCYVLNSSQTGKTSLLVRTMSRLRKNRVECAFIDLSGEATKNISPETWYKGLINKLINSLFETKEQKIIKFDEWWEQNQSYSVLARFQKFLEEILLVKIEENIVIFIDEIGSVLSLNFSTDDFINFIRSCYQQRHDNPQYKRLTFCLLGIASPSDLIKDKNLTAFNIGKAIFLEPIQLTDDVEPLIEGLRGSYSNSEAIAVFNEILCWTGGQPFLTQKLCSLMVEEFQKENPSTVKEVVRQRIIANWEYKDNPQHLRTIRDRIINNEQLAPYLLELYAQVWQIKEPTIIAHDTLEHYKLQLSGLVVREKNKLRVYNPIYEKIFDKNWIENELYKLCPYSENLKAWVASKYKDNSRLLRGVTLQKAHEWSKDKRLSPQHMQFLLSSQNQEQEEELSILKIESALERERQDKEAAEQRNQVLAEANDTLNEAKKIHKRQIRVWRITLGVTFLLSIILGSSTFITYKTVQRQSKSISNIKEILYDDLENRLKNKELKAADEITSKIVWETANTWQAPSFRAEDSRNFPCQDLRRIDDLWTKYSDRRFGFSVQKRIWQSSEVNRDIIKFMSRVGWGRLDTNPNGNSTVVFLQTDLSRGTFEEGQLPWSVTWYGSDGTRDRTAYLNRISECLSDNK